MQVNHQLARHLKEVHFGVNWTWSNLKDNLAGVTWQQATSQVYGLNTIAALVYHIHYYVGAVTKVLEGGPLDAHDKFSFACPPIQSPEDWDQLTTQALQGAERLAALIEQLPDERLPEVFVLEKYGNYLRNLLGLIEHTHYHLGQIVVIKKIVQQLENGAAEAG